MASTLGDRSIEAHALSLLAGLSFLANDRDAGQLHAEVAVALARQIGDVHLLGDMLGVLAITAQDEDKRSIRLEAPLPTSRSRPRSMTVR